MTGPASGAGGPGDPPDLSLDMVTAALRADSADLAIYARVLTQSLGEALPPECVTVDWDRSMSDRMRGRPGQVSKITVRLGDRVMTLGVQRGAPVAEICSEVRGVVLSRQQVQMGVWAEELARALVAHAEENAEAARALRRLVAGS
jgi:hypothetical protein